MFADKKPSNTTQMSSTAANATQGVSSSGEFLASTLPNESIKFSALGGDHDFHLMVAKEHEQNYSRLREENQDLRECLKQLQRELFEVIAVKQDLFSARYKAEYGEGAADKITTQEQIAHQVEEIREEVFGMGFEESGRDLMQRFKLNFQRLKEFLTMADQEIASLAVFNQKRVEGSLASDRMDEHSLADQNSSVNNLKALLKNYECLVEGQNNLLTTSITKMAKIPPPDEITATFNRF